MVTPGGLQEIKIQYKRNKNNRKEKEVHVHRGLHINLEYLTFLFPRRNVGFLSIILLAFKITMLCGNFHTISLSLLSLLFI